MNKLQGLTFAVRNGVKKYDNSSQTAKLICLKSINMLLLNMINT